jgi:hypothetical protein
VELVEPAVVVVDPKPVHPEIVVVAQLVCVIVATVEMLPAPDMKDVERETISVQIGTAVLPVQEVEDELSEVLVDC